MHSFSVLRPDSTWQELTLPATWGELTGEQLAHVAMVRNMDLPEPAAKNMLLYALAGVPRTMHGKLHNEDMLFTAEDGTVKYLPELDWAFKAPLLQKSLVPSFTVRSLRARAFARSVKPVTFTGPASQLKNFTVLQFNMADVCLQAIHAQKTEQAINNFLGCIYWPQGTTWTRQHIEQRGALLASMPANIKLAAVLNFQGIRADLPILYREVFRKRNDDDDEPDYGIQGMLESLAGNKFGTVEEVPNMPLTPVLIHCDRAARAARKLKAESEKK